MINEFIPYEEALALKELGFGEECLGMYYDAEDGVKYTEPTWKLLVGGKTDGENEYEVKAPLYQQAFRWFREKYDEYHTWMLQRILSVEDYETYEKSELECLRQLIKIVKQNKQDEKN